MIDYQETIDRLKTLASLAPPGTVPVDAITLLKHYREGLEVISKGNYPRHDIETFGDEADIFARKTLEGPE